ncbi:uncharacterized protein LOC128838359 isoform X2 [Malaclemys terrapin pileata]|uniref:uncharacterized protein LOC128838359 isoform X2 n=1 Tax=Malaclemys terrapin pileata TaxID=2991368 RepID=UPI0023A8424B|nr:uncharacterized protein LOC128838359 isoform X2 [Malaclemys terrapin pileata]
MFFQPGGIFPVPALFSAFLLSCPVCSSPAFLLASWLLHQPLDLTVCIPAARLGSLCTNAYEESLSAPKVLTSKEKRQRNGGSRNRGEVTCPNYPGVELEIEHRSPDSQVNTKLTQLDCQVCSFTEVLKGKVFIAGLEEGPVQVTLCFPRASVRASHHQLPLPQRFNDALKQSRKLLVTSIQQIGSYQVHPHHLDRIDSGTELYTNCDDLAENVPELINRICN